MSVETGLYGIGILALLLLRIPVALAMISVPSAASRFCSASSRPSA